MVIAALSVANGILRFLHWLHSDCLSPCDYYRYVNIYCQAQYCHLPEVLSLFFDPPEFQQHKAPALIMAGALCCQPQERTE